MAAQRCECAHCCEVKPREFSLGDRKYCPNHPPRWCCPNRAPLTSAHRACQLVSRPKGGAISRHLAPSRWYQHAYGYSDQKKYRLRRKPVPEKNAACGAHATTPHPGHHACCGELLDFMMLFRIASPYICICICMAITGTGATCVHMHMCPFLVRWFCGL